METEREIDPFGPLFSPYGIPIPLSENVEAKAAYWKFWEKIVKEEDSSSEGVISKWMEDFEDQRSVSGPDNPVSQTMGGPSLDIAIGWIKERLSLLRSPKFQRKRDPWATDLDSLLEDALIARPLYSVIFYAISANAD